MSYGLTFLNIYGMPGILLLVYMHQFIIISVYKYKRQRQTNKQKPSLSGIQVPETGLEFVSEPRLSAAPCHTACLRQRYVYPGEDIRQSP